MRMIAYRFKLPLFFGMITFLFISAATKGYGLALPESGEAFKRGVDLLADGDFDQKAAAVELLVDCGDARSAKVLEALLAGNLYTLKSDGTLVTAQPAGEEFTIVSVQTDATMGGVKKRKLSKVSINNNLRSLIETSLARLRLTHPDPALRRSAINKMLATVNADLRADLGDLLNSETDRRVREALQTAMALIDLRKDPPADRDVRLAAVRKLERNLNPAVRSELTRLIASETDSEVRKAALQSADGIDDRLAWLHFVETLFFGLSLGSVLVLAAIGLAITFGVIGVINMAHGELIMIGAYTTYVLQLLLPNAISAALILSIPIAFTVAAIVGIVIERSVIRFLYGRPLETLLATFGISLVLQQAVRSIFSPLNRSVSTPDWMSGVIQFNEALALTTNRVMIFIFALLVFAGLTVLLKKSVIGLQVRAVSQNRAMARAMGVRAARVDALTFGLGSGIAGIAGVALSQLTNVGPNLGQAYIVDSFMVVVFGGVGNLWGTLLGGLTLGVANKFLEPWTGAMLSKIMILIGIIIFIQKRPQGIFPQKGRVAG